MHPSAAPPPRANADPMLAHRRIERLQADSTRVIARYFQDGDARTALRYIRPILAMDPAVAQRTFNDVRAHFSQRHRDLVAVLRDNCDRLAKNLVAAGCEDEARAVAALNDWRRLLVGAYCTSEFSAEAAAFFNPSIVPHPDQSGLPSDGLRFVISFRATGEGHISSIAFRSGVIDSEGRIDLDRVTPYLSTPRVETDAVYDRELFARRLAEAGALDPVGEAVLGGLGATFTRTDLERSIERVRYQHGEDNAMGQVMHQMRWLAECNYAITFPQSHDICERLIFPVSPREENGIEDARFVRFVEDDGAVAYYATCTAYSGRSMAAQMLETTDFLSFHMCTLNGAAVAGKGLALFPRRIGGDYVMLGRQDGFRLTISRSQYRHFWHDAQELLVPQEPWEIVKTGNCGSPIETEAGWLVITHGIGPMRRYCLGAALLDRDEPERVIGRLRQPLLEPLEDEREGYVPNVVYSCGALAHNGQLVLPYAMSDSASA
ncbi:MAG: glycoside hydrolase family 130 protein, partial [Planctomycetota bacterium]